MKKKIILFILIILLVYAVGGIIFVIFKDKENKKVVSNLDTIVGYNYNLKSTATLLYKDEFNLLKSNLESESVIMEDYAKSIAKLFIIDLYTIKNKINKYDVGGIDFVYPSGVENFKLNAQDTLYKYVEDDSNGYRKQDLPEVSSIEIVSIEENDYTLYEDDFEGYKLSLKWDYVTDLGYDTEGEVIIIKAEDKLYIVEKN